MSDGGGSTLREVKCTADKVRRMFTSHDVENCLTALPVARLGPVNGY